MNNLPYKRCLYSIKFIGNLAPKKSTIQPQQNFLPHNLLHKERHPHSCVLHAIQRMSISIIVSILLFLSSGNCSNHCRQRFYSTSAVCISSFFSSSCSFSLYRSTPGCTKGSKSLSMQLTAQAFSKKYTIFPKE